MRPARDLHEKQATRSAGHPVRRGASPDIDGMDARKIVPLESPGGAAPIEGSPAVEPGAVEAHLHLVESGRPEQPDHQQQRRAFQARCGDIAVHLARLQRFEDRVEFYRLGVVSRLELTTAAALYPEQMPTLNGEWEWIALTMADHEDD